MSRFGTQARNSGAVKDFLRRANIPAPTPSTSWVRPTEWLSMPDTSSGQKIAILMAVFDNPRGNLFAVTISGAYTVDWGDGTSTNYNAGVKAEKNFSYSAITTDTSTQKATLYNGYKQVVITITPQAGQNLTSVNFNVRHSTDGRSSGTWIWTDTQFLDVNMVGSSVATLNMGSSSGLVRHRILENFQFTGSNSVTTMNNAFISSSLRRFSMNCSSLTNAGYMFLSCNYLIEVDITTTSSLTDTAFMFNSCSSLLIAPFFITSGVAAAQYMFAGCDSLMSVPQYNWAAATNVSGMFSGCGSLRYLIQRYPVATNTAFIATTCTALRAAHITAPASTTFLQIFKDCTSLTEVGYMASANVTTFQQAFDGCRSLREIPWVIDCTSATTVTDMFINCSSLQRVAGLSNMGNVTSIAHMFNGCNSLEYAPDMSSLDSSCVTANYTFNNCYSLVELPNIGTAQISAWSYHAFNCQRITSIPASYNFSYATGSMVGAFQYCNNLRSFPDISANPSSLNNTFNGCSTLKSAPSIGMSNVTNLSGTFALCSALKSTPSSYACVNATTVADMFMECYNLVTIPDIDTRKCGNTSGNFGGPMPSVQTILKTQFPQSFTIREVRLTAAELDAIYTNLPDRTARTITNVTAASGTVTYTTSVAHNYQRGMTVSMTGISPTAYNLTNVLIADVPTSTTFTVTNAATGTYVSGGTVTPAALNIAVTNALGAAADTPTIATNKGWTVTG